VSDWCSEVRAARDLGPIVAVDAVRGLASSATGEELQRGPLAPDEPQRVCPMVPAHEGHESGGDVLPARMREAWRWGVAKGLVPDRVLAPYRIKVDEREVAICHGTPQPVEVEAVLARTFGEPGLALLILAVIGARVGEAFRLVGADFDRFYGTIRLGEKTSPRWFPLTSSDPQLFAELAT